MINLCNARKTIVILLQINKYYSKNKKYNSNNNLSNNNS